MIRALLFSLIEDPSVGFFNIGGSVTGLFLSRDVETGADNVGPRPRTVAMLCLPSFWASDVEEGPDVEGPSVKGGDVVGLLSGTGVLKFPMLLEFRGDCVGVVLMNPPSEIVLNNAATCFPLMRSRIALLPQILQKKFSSRDPTSSSSTPLLAE